MLQACVLQYVLWTVTHQHFGQHTSWKWGLLPYTLWHNSMFLLDMELVFQSWKIHHGTSVLLSIRKAEHSRSETVGERCTCQNSQSYSILTQLHDLGRGVITCQSHLAAWWVFVHFSLHWLHTLESQKQWCELHCQQECSVSSDNQIIIMCVHINICYIWVLTSNIPYMSLRD